MSNNESNPTCIGLDEVFDPDAFRDMVLEGFLPPSDPTLNENLYEGDRLQSK